MLKISVILLFTVISDSESRTHQAKGPCIIILTDIIEGHIFQISQLRKMYYQRWLDLKKKKKTCYIYVILISEAVLPTCNFTWQINKWFSLLWVEYFHSVIWINHEKLVEPMRFKDIIVVTTSHLFSPCYGDLNAFKSLLSENDSKGPLVERTLVRDLSSDLFTASISLNSQLSVWKMGVSNRMVFIGLFQFYTILCLHWMGSCWKCSLGYQISS